MLRLLLALEVSALNIVSFVPGKTQWRAGLEFSLGIDPSVSIRTRIKIK